MTATIKIKDEILQKFSIEKLEKFINSDDFEDFILSYQMIKGETGKTQSFNSFKKELGLKKNYDYRSG